MMAEEDQASVDRSDCPAVDVHRQDIQVDGPGLVRQAYSCLRRVHSCHR